jgi:Ca2+-transporting ATPase
MTVTKAWISNSQDFQKLDPSLKSQVDEAISVNSTAVVRQDSGLWEFLGNKTECALLVYVNKSYEKIRDQNMVVKRFNFSSERKRMTTIIQLENKTWRLHTKGASEVILELSTNVLVGGNVVPMSSELKKEIGGAINSFATQGEKKMRTWILRLFRVTYYFLGI